jgi:hypothetical protein
MSNSNSGANTESSENNSSRFLYFKKYFPDIWISIKFSEDNNASFFQFGIALLFLVIFILAMVYATSKKIAKIRRTSDRFELKLDSSPKGSFQRAKGKKCHEWKNCLIKITRFENFGFIIS